jgi:hypothetical protein
VRHVFLISFCVLITSSPSYAVLVEALDFSNGAQWSVVVSPSGDAVATGTSGVLGGGSGLRTGKASGAAGTVVLVTATLIGTIDTTGFTDLELSFTNTIIDNLEYDATSGTYGSAGDGFLITSSQSISFDTSGANGGAFETALDPGAPVMWTPALAATHSQDLEFDATAENGSISNLIIRLQVNATAERIDLTSFEVNGTAIPEPGAALCGGLVSGIFGLVAVGRRFRGTSSSSSTA